MREEISTAWPVKRFLRRLASSNPAPGGGSAAALAGALGAALGCMVIGLLLCRKRIKPVERRRLQQDRRKLARIGRNLERLISEDARAYRRLVQAQQKGRASRRRMQALRRAAAGCPMQICAGTAEALERMDGLQRFTGPYLGSDVRAGQELLQGAFGAATAMVEINRVAQP